MSEIIAGAPRPWLRPLHPAFLPPGAGLLRTLEGHSAGVLGAAVALDGKRAASASGDCTLKVWELDDGRAMRALEGHFYCDAAVHCCAIAGDAGGRVHFLALEEAKPPHSGFAALC